MWTFASLPRLLFQALAAGALYVLPGQAALRMAGVAAASGRMERLALAFGLSLALGPLAFEAASLVGLPWTAATTVGYVALAAGVAFWPSAGQSRAALQRTPGSHLRAWAPRLRFSWDAALLAGLGISATLMRMFVVRDLAVPMWADSYHHTLITQLIIDHGGLFTSWQPYVPLSTFTYHYGFHAHAALFHWLTGASVSESVLAFGQIANAGAGLGAYLLTLRMTGNRTAAIWAAALTLFVNPVPAYYVNWGRYTQLAGQAILPTALALWIDCLSGPRRWRAIALAAVVTAGMITTHYIVTALLALFVFGYALCMLARRPTLAALWRIGGASAAIGALSLALTAPWIANVLNSKLSQIASGYISTTTHPYGVTVANLLPLTPFYLKGGLIILAGAGIWLALARRNWTAALLAVWCALLALAVNPAVIGLPGAGIVTNFAAALTIYVVAIPLAAYPLGVAQDWLVRLPAAGRLMVPPGAVRLGCAGLLVGLTIWSATWQTKIIDPQYQLYTPADASAMEWIRAATPPDATFLVNAYAGYDNKAYIGDDGGWWIPYMTGRKATLPPMVYGTERGEDPTYAQQVNAFNTALRDHPLPSPEAIALLRANAVGYVYTGPHTSINPRIDVAALRNLPALFSVVYDQGGVVIFALKPAP